MTTSGDPADPDAERVLQQALRAMAGGQTDADPGARTQLGGMRWSTTQVILLALVIGLTVGMVAGIVSLLV
jgi:hypothetical protein